MSFQWTFLATFLYCEIAIVIILLLPIISPSRWQKIFKSRLVAAFAAGSKYYFNFIICIFGLLFLDSIRELRKYSTYTPTKESLATPHAEAHAHMKQFRSQRNFYIAGFALFLWFVIKRLIGLMSMCAIEMANSTAARKQAEGARRYADTVTADDLKKGDLKKNTPVPTGDAPRSVDPAEHDAKVAELKQALDKSKLDYEELNKTYVEHIKEYERLGEENRKLNIKLSVLSGEKQESSKDK